MQAGRMQADAIPAPSAPPLIGCLVISLRPAGGHAAVRRAATAQGARLLALSPWRLQPLEDAGTRKSLAAALAAPRVIFTSPAAVSAAHRLQRLEQDPETQWFAVGAGTADVLHRAGVKHVHAPARMDSEGLLDLPSLQRMAGTDVGLITAPGGRERIGPMLQARGGRILRADVYSRVAIAPSPRAVATLRALDAPAWLLLSSGGALDAILAALPADASARLRSAQVVAASARLQAIAHACGFGRCIVASSARPPDLLAAAAAAHPLA